jgi:hypothetical protein
MNIPNLSDEEVLRRADLEDGLSVLAGSPKYFRRIIKQAAEDEAKGAAGMQVVAKRAGGTAASGAAEYADGQEPRQKAG